MNYKAINDAASMTDILAAYSIEMDTKRNVALCPFHSDTNPSMHIYPHSFYCFACNTGGDVIKFIQRIEDCSPREAAEKVMQITGQQAQKIKTDYRTRRKIDERKQAEAEADRLLGERFDLDREIAEAQRIIDESNPYSASWEIAWRRLNNLLMRNEELTEREILNREKRTNTRS